MLKGNFKLLYKGKEEPLQRRHLSLEDRDPSEADEATN
jgi:hypothetical protein